MSAVLHSGSAAGILPPSTLPRELALSNGWLIVIALLGTALNLVAYQSFEPIPVSILFYVTGLLLVALSSRQHTRLQCAVFTRMFSIAWLMTGVGGIFAEIFRDEFQLSSDAATFYEFATSELRGLGLDEVSLVTESVAAVFAWRFTYDLFAALGFEKGRYIGILLNDLAVAFSGVIALRAAFSVYGFDVARLRRLQVLLYSCGLFWLFCSVHLRDSFVLLVSTLSFYLWIRFLEAPGTLRLLRYLVASLPLYGAFALLRAEFVFIPAMLCVAALLVVGWTRASRSPVLAFCLLFGGLLGAAAAWVVLGENFLFVFESGTETYSNLAASEAAADSLGMKLIVEQPVPIRLVAGSAMLFVYPIPMWAGLQFDSVTFFFKSLTAPFFYFFTPLFLLGGWRVLSQRAARTPISLFLLGTMVACTAAIAMTSMETRHFGGFLVPGFLLALLPAIDQPRDRSAYRDALALFLSAIVAVHLLWALLKLL
jgi:hypothetical protein